MWVDRRNRYLIGTVMGHTRIDDLIARTTAEHAEIRTEIRRLDDRLRAIELAVRPDPAAE